MENYKNINKFLIKNEEILEKFLLDPKSVESKSLYKNHIDELKLDMINEIFKEINKAIESYKDFHDDKNEFLSLSVSNKIEILSKLKKIKMIQDEKRMKI